MNELQVAREKILEYFHQAAAGKLTKNVPVGSLTEEGKKYLSELSGLGFRAQSTFMLNPSDLKHIYGEHYGQNEKDKGSNIPLADNDIMNLADVMATPDEVIYLGYDKKTDSKKFAFLKKSEGGAYNLLEVYGNSGGKLSAKTFFNAKKGIAVGGKKISTLLSTSENDSGVLAQRVMVLNKAIPKLVDFENRGEL
jgi:hypothetical protein